MAIWHPFLKAPNNEVSRPVTLPASGAATLSTALDLRMAGMRRGGY